jgi:ABC-type multidrug transport system fused ATPase/permease subunit
MKKLFCYVFYRASKFYKSWGESNNYYISGKFLLFLALCANVLTLIGLFCLLLKIKYSIEVVCATWFVFCILSFFILNEKKYEELAEKYKNEKNSKLKGWLVFLYIISSVILYFVSLLICGYWVSIKI